MAAIPKQLEILKKGLAKYTAKIKTRKDTVINSIAKRENMAIRMPSTRMISMPVKPRSSLRCPPRAMGYRGLDCTISAHDATSATD